MTMIIPQSLSMAARQLIRLAEADPAAAVSGARALVAGCHNESPEAAGTAWYSLGWTLMRWERHDEALPAFEHAIAHWSRAAHPFPLHARRAVLIWRWVGGAGVDIQAEWQQVVRAYAESGLAFEATLTQLYQAAHLNMLGEAAAALDLIAMVEQPIKTQGTRDDLARWNRIKGNALINKGALIAAGEYLTQALALFEETGSTMDRAKCLLDRAHLAYRAEQFTAGLCDLAQAIERILQLDLPVSMMIAQKIHGLLLTRLGRYHEAMAVTVAARTRCLEQRRPTQAASCDLNLGNIAYYSGLLELALAAYRRAEAVFSDQGYRREQVVAARNQALVWRLRGSAAQAFTLLTDLIPLATVINDRLELAELTFAQAQALIDLNDVRQARVYLDRARSQFLALGNAPAAAECQMAQGWMYLHQALISQAHTCFSEADQPLRAQPIHRWRVLHGLGRCANAEGNDAAALEFYEQASQLIATLRQTLMNEHASSGFFRQAAELHGDQIRLALGREDSARLLDCSERQRALTLLQRLATLEFQVPMADQETYIESHLHLRAAVQAKHYSADFDQSVNMYLDILLRAQHTTMPAERIAVPSLDINSLRQALSHAFPDGWTVVAYQQHEAHLIVMTLTATTLEHSTIQIDTQLNRLLEQATTPRYQMLTYVNPVNQPGQPWTTLENLGKRLLPSSLRNDGGADQRLIIVPDGILHRVPWAALRLDGRWLVEHLVPHIVPSLHSWQILQQRAVSSASPLFIGCSHFGDRAEHLWSVDEEQALISAIWTEPIEVLRDEAATCAEVLRRAQSGALAGYGLIHWSTHAQLTASQGLLAHIKLWDEDLFYADILRLHLNGALIILSVCEGGNPEVLAGEEILSLNRALLHAGGRDIISTLWASYDATTPLFMELLYRHLAAGLDSAQAVAATQRACIKRSADPHNAVGLSSYIPLMWAGFQCLGAGTWAIERAGGTSPAALSKPSA